MLERTGARIHLWTALRNLVMLLGRMGHHEQAALLLGATDGRVSPTFGDELRRLVETEQAARTAMPGFDMVFERGQGIPVHDVPTIARSIIRSAQTG
jgi:hypothetical protein